MITVSYGREARIAEAVLGQNGPDCGQEGAKIWKDFRESLFISTASSALRNGPDRWVGMDRETSFFRALPFYGHPHFQTLRHNTLSKKSLELLKKRGL